MSRPQGGVVAVSGLTAVYKGSTDSQSVGCPNGLWIIQYRNGTSKDAGSGHQIGCGIFRRREVGGTWHRNTIAVRESADRVSDSIAAEIVGAAGSAGKSERRGV